MPPITPDAIRQIDESDFSRMDYDIFTTDNLEDDVYSPDITGGVDFWKPTNLSDTFSIETPV